MFAMEVTSSLLQILYLSDILYLSSFSLSVTHSFDQLCFADFAKTS